MVGCSVSTVVNDIFSKGQFARVGVQKLPSTPHWQLGVVLGGLTLYLALVFQLPALPLDYNFVHHSGIFAHIPWNVSSVVRGLVLV